jgi:hypothetical protein
MKLDFGSLLNSLRAKRALLIIIHGVTDAYQVPAISTKRDVRHIFGTKCQEKTSPLP